MKQKFKLSTILLFGLLAVVLLPTNVSAASIIVVNSTADIEADDGVCTLREAIKAANDDTASGATTGECTAGSGADTINFNIPGSGVRLIQPTSPLSAITEPVIINGYSQPGAIPNTAASPAPLNGTILIEINGENAGVGAVGINANSDDVTISGLSVNEFTNSGIYIGNDRNNVAIEGNYIGTDATGMIDKGNGVGVDTSGSSDVLVGGNTPEKRNLISGNTTANHSIFGSPAFNVFTSAIRVQGNLIGTNKAAKIDSNFNQGLGIVITGEPTDILIGGTSVAAGNIIAGNSEVGVAINTVEVQVYSLELTPQKVSVLGNYIYGNSPGQFGDGLGIDLLKQIDSSPIPDGVPEDFVNVGVTLNDAGDIDTGSNNYINFPVLNAAEQKDNQLSVDFNLDAADSPSNQYRIEFFANDEADPTGYGEGQIFLSAVTVGNGNNQQVITNVPSGLDLNGKYISATTTAVDNTNPSGFGSTSEFSAVKRVQDPSITTTLANTGSNRHFFIALTCLVLLLPSGLLIHQLKSKY